MVDLGFEVKRIELNKFILSKFKKSCAEFENHFFSVDATDFEKTILEIKDTHYVIHLFKTLLTTSTAHVVLYGPSFDDKNIDDIAVQMKDIQTDGLVIKLCALNPIIDEAGDITLSEESFNLIEKMKNRSDVEFYIHELGCIQSAKALQAIFRILQEKRSDTSHLWLLGNMDKSNNEFLLFYMSQQIRVLGDRMQSFSERLPGKPNLDSILKGVLLNSCSNLEITKLAEVITLEIGNEIVGNIADDSYTLRQSWIVKDLKSQLVDKILKRLCQEIIQKIQTILFDKVEEDIEKKMPYFILKRIFHVEIEAVIMSLLGVITEEHIAIVMFFVTLFSPVDVNSITWRHSVAKELFTATNERIDELTKRISKALLKRISKLQKTVMDFVEGITEIQLNLQASIDPESFEYICYTKHDFKLDQTMRIRCMNALQSLSEHVKIDMVRPGYRKGKEVIAIFVPEDIPVFSSLFDAECGVVYMVTGQPSQENQLINEYIATKNLIIDGKVKYSLEETIEKYAHKLMQLHSNLSSISASAVKSRMNGTSLEKCACIAIYCTFKGIVPLGESEFPKSLDNFVVDVREGFAIPACGPCSICDPLRCGCSIGIHGRRSSGSIGLFVQEQNSEDIGFLTCFHVLYGLDTSQLPQHRLNKLETAIGPAFQYNGGEFVVQPSDEDSEKNTVNNDQSMEDDSNSPATTTSNASVAYPAPALICGEVVNGYLGAVYIEQRRSAPKLVSVDAAYIRISDRRPDNAMFPKIDINSDDDKWKSRGCFNGNLRIGGIIQGMDEADRGDAWGVVYKYGRTTGLTRGLFNGNRAEVKMTYGNCFRHLKNQYEVIASKDLPFFSSGDSGAAIFMEKQNKLYCIGLGSVILDSAGTTCYVIPIEAVLSALDPPLEIRTFDITSAFQNMKLN